MRIICKTVSNEKKCFTWQRLYLIIIASLFIVTSTLSSCGSELICKSCGVKKNESSTVYDPTVVGEFEYIMTTNFNAMARCERGFGNLVADAMIWKGLDAEIAFINAGSIRRQGTTDFTYIGPGSITLGELALAFPYDNSEALNPAKIIVISISGSIIKDALENSLSRMETDGAEGVSFGRFLQVAGIKYYADVRNSVGSRILSAIILSTDEAIDLTDNLKKYRVAIPSKYIKDYPGFQDYDGYWEIFAKEASSWAGVDTDTLVFDATVDFIKKYTPITNYSDYEKINEIYPDDCRDPYTTRMSIEHE